MRCFESNKKLELRACGL